MIPLWAAVAGMLIAGPAVAASPAPRRPVKARAGEEFWSLAAALPLTPRVEGRLLRAEDNENARAALKIWMEENHGVSTDNGTGGDSRSGWMVPVENLREMDAMLAQYGKLTRRSSQVPRGFERGSSTGSPDTVVSALIDAKTVVDRRDGLQRELDALGDRARTAPDIVLLASAFISTLDNLAMAREKYDAFYFADIELAGNTALPSEMVPGPTGLIRLNAPIAVTELLPRHYSMDPGAVRAPRDGSQGTDYLSWPALTPTLDETVTLKVQLLSNDAAGTAQRVDEELLRAGAEPASLKPLPSSQGSRTVMADRTLYSAQPLTGYLIRRQDLERIRAILNAHGQLAGWTPIPRGKELNIVAGGRWAQALASELARQPDGLAPFPNLRSLVDHQLRRLKVFRRLSGSPPDELLGLEVLDKNGGRDLPKLPPATLRPGDANYLPPPPPVPQPGTPSP